MLYYFAYGSNLDKKQMQERCPESKPIFVSTLPNYKLVFVGWSRQWRGGVATIKHLMGKKVAGAIYQVSERDLMRLDKYEGYPVSNQRLNVVVFDEDGNPVEAVTYIGAGKLEETQPSKAYVEIMQRGYRDWGISGIK